MPCAASTRNCAQRHGRQLRRKLRPDARERFQIARLILVPNSGVRITPAMRGTEQQAILRRDQIAAPACRHVCQRDVRGRHLPPDRAQRQVSQHGTAESRRDDDCIERTFALHQPTAVHACDLIHAQRANRSKPGAQQSLRRDDQRIAKMQDIAIPPQAVSGKQA